MKTFTLAIIALIFASCETVTPPPTVSSEDDDKYYEFDLSVTVTPEFDPEFTVNETVNLTNKAYPDSAWIARFSHFYCNYYLGAQGDKTIETDGDFTINFSYDYQDHTDTIYGSGYFDADTLYLNYHYQRLDGTPYSGDVSIHSL